ncbi:hypothetical protein ACX80U_03685 [Arthrobacter sp. TmT3-37]
MTSDEDLDPPVPSYLEGIELKRVHDGKILEEDGDASSSPNGASSSSDSASSSSDSADA